MPKVTIIGAGNVGGAAAYAIAQRGIADVVLVDVIGDLAKGKALDMSHALAGSGADVTITGTDDYALIANSDIIVITAGIARKAGMLREDLLATNKKIVLDVCEQIKKYAPNSIVIVVTNPLDLITGAAYQALQSDKKKVIGMGGQLDCLRFAHMIKKHLKASYHDIVATVIGMHGEHMVPVPEYSTVKGIPITQLLAPQEIEEINNETRNGSLDILKLSGSTYYAPGESIRIMAESILLNQQKIICCCTLLDGEYGAKGVFLGVPARIGKEGVEKIIPLKLGKETQKQFKDAVKAVRDAGAP